MTIELVREHMNILLKKHSRRSVAMEIGISPLTLERFIYGANITFKTLDRILVYLKEHDDTLQQD